MGAAQLRARFGIPWRGLGRAPRHRLQATRWPRFRHRKKDCRCPQVPKFGAVEAFSRRCRFSGGDRSSIRRETTMSATAPPRVDPLANGSEAETRPPESVYGAARTNESGVALVASERLVRSTNAGSEEEVTADSRAILACMAAPPRDVGRMLRRHDASLPRYLDVHRLQQIEASHRRWPLLGKPLLGKPLLSTPEAAASARGRR